MPPEGYIAPKWDFTWHTCFPVFDWPQFWADVHATHMRFLIAIAPAKNEPPLISILTKTTNALWLKLGLKQPCWSARRWRSKT